MRSAASLIGSIRLSGTLPIPITTTTPTPPPTSTSTKKKILRLRLGPGDSGDGSEKKIHHQGEGKPPASSSPCSRRLPWLFPAAPPRNWKRRSAAEIEVQSQPPPFGCGAARVVFPATSQRRRHQEGETLTPCCASPSQEVLQAARSSPSRSNRSRCRLEEEKYVAAPGNCLQHH
ncbi:hypothetical protein Droror1_Dr00011763 [Drosera rotundifolia]